MLEEKTLLIGVGAQKAGTTWLARYLEEHPDVFMAPLKELNYFTGRKFGFAETDKRLIKRMTKLAIKLANSPHSASAREKAIFENALARTQMIGDTRKYLEYFDSRIGEEKIASEISPTYALLGPEDFERIYTLHSSVKFIFIMRNPVDRYWSQLRFHQNRMHRIGEPFDAGEQVVAKLGDSKFFGFGDYPKTIQALSRTVPREDLFFAFYEELFRNETVSEICQFLEIQDCPAEFGSRFNVSPDVEMLEEDRERIYQVFSFVYDDVRAFMGRLPEDWEADVRAFSSTSAI